MYTCIIVDDQTEAVGLLKDHVQKTPLLSLKLATTEPVEALALLDKEHVDIVFLDIEMPGITGIEIIETLKAKWGNNMPKMVLTTGYDGYALSGYEFGVADYLLKPISYARFRKAVDRIIHDLDQTRNKPRQADHFFVELDGRKVKVMFKEIIYVEGARNYVIIVSDKQKMCIYKSMTEMDEILSGHNFFRIHNSFIIALDKIHAINGREVTLPVKDSFRTIPIGITRKAKFLLHLKLRKY
jgi:DNA-binding LytR/AlgR family response regulator